MISITKIEKIGGKIQLICICLLQKPSADSDLTSQAFLCLQVFAPRFSEGSQSVGYSCPPDSHLCCMIWGLHRKEFSVLCSGSFPISAPCIGAASTPHHHTFAELVRRLGKNYSCRASARFRPHREVVFLTFSYKPSQVLPLILRNSALNNQTETSVKNIWHCKQQVDSLLLLYLANESLRIRTREKKMAGYCELIKMKITEIFFKILKPNNLNVEMFGKSV